MAVDVIAAKQLWRRAAGICSNHDCCKDITALLKGSATFSVVEISHVIAPSAEQHLLNTGRGSDDC